MRLSFAIALLSLWGCSQKTQAPQPPPPEPEQPVAVTPEPLPPPHVPTEPQAFPPVLTAVDGQYDEKIHTDFQVCVQCHADIVEQWKDSPKAFASLANPFFRASFDEFVADADHQKSTFCSSCHDPALMLSGAIESEVPATDPRAHVGITCGHCHSIASATIDGNASHVLATTPIPFPIPGDDASLQRHFDRVAPPILRKNELCISCHKNFLTLGTGHDVVIPGLNDGTPFLDSGYAGNATSRIDAGVEKKDCITCHMPPQGPKDQGSHRFAGGHATLAAAIGSEPQLEAIRAMVENAAMLDVAAVGVGPVALRDAPTALAAGDEVWADVVVFNHNTGHHFPAGAKDLRDTFIEVVIEDAQGKVLASAGTEHEATSQDPTVVKLHSVLASTGGEIVHRHRVHEFRAPIIDRTIGPRDALVARYSWIVPENPPKLPLTVRAKLRHRRLHAPLTERACADSKTERAKAFTKKTREVLGRTIDACVTQPVIEIDSAWAKLGSDEHANKKPDWERQYHRGMGLLHNLQENLPEAIEAFEAAQALLPADAPKVDHAKIAFMLGNAAARQGRTNDAMDHWSKAEMLVGEHPAIHFVRGTAYQRVFRNDQATEWFVKASKLVDDERVWRHLAISAGSAKQPRIAYEAALRGLALEPRDPHLLRSQMLALKALGADEAWQKQAHASFMAYERDEVAPHVRDKCSAADPLCREEREPMRVVQMR